MGCLKTDLIQPRDEFVEVLKTGRAASDGQENPVLKLRGSCRGMKMPKMADLGPGGAKNDRDGGAGGEK